MESEENNMGAFIVRQPNGKLARYSSVVDAITHYNMTEEEYIEYCADVAREEARYRIKYGLYPYERIEEEISRGFYGEMTKEEYEKIKIEMEKEDESISK